MLAKSYKRREQRARQRQRREDAAKALADSVTIEEFEELATTGTSASLESRIDETAKRLKRQQPPNAPLTPTEKRRIEEQEEAARLRGWCVACAHHWRPRNPYPVYRCPRCGRRGTVQYEKLADYNELMARLAAGPGDYQP